jgi:hypothetical protein
LPGLSEFTLAHDPDSQAVVVRLTAACTTSGATQRPSDQPGARRYERTDAPSGQVSWYTVFAGGCITAQLHPAGNTTTFADQGSSALGFTTRRSLEQTLDARSSSQLHLDPGQHTMINPAAQTAGPRPAGRPVGATAAGRADQANEASVLGARVSRARTRISPAGWATRRHHGHLQRWRPGRPSPVPQQLHLDLTIVTAQDLDTQHGRALDLGVGWSTTARQSRGAATRLPPSAGTLVHLRRHFAWAV